MRIIFGAYGQGHGHFSKAAILVPLLESRGHEVRVVSSGPETPPTGYHFAWHRHYPGLGYQVVDGKANATKTLKHWLRNLPTLLKHLTDLRQMTRDWQPDLILSDFEPLTGSKFLKPKCEVIALSRQVTLLDRAIPLPSGSGLEKHVTKSVTKLFTSGADRRFGYHYAPATPHCTPPMIRDSLSRLRPETGDHLLVYNHYHFAEGGQPEALIGWANRNDVEVKAYGFPMVKRGRQGRVTFCPVDRQQMPRDLATCRGIFCTAGFNTPVEAFRLGKPTALVPIPGNWEQSVNAHQLDELDVAAHCTTWDYDRLFDRPAPAADHPLRRWLSASPSDILSALLPDVVTQPDAREIAIGA